MVVEPDTRGARGRMDGDAGLYGPGSEAWRTNREATLLLGAGPRALLLQIAHPLVAEGVDQHSGFREDPWSRLARTTRSYLRIVYGTRTEAQAEIRRLNAMHRTIQGPTRDLTARRRHGVRYTARDPELLLWVHATLVDSTIVVYDRWLGPLTRDRRERYYEETRPIGRAFGVPEDRLPRDLDAFEAYLASMLALDGPVHPTSTARELAHHILHPSLGPLAPPSVRRIVAAIPTSLYDWTLWPAVGLLPTRVREEFGLPWGAAERLTAAWLTRTWLAWRRVLPSSFRQFRQARDAERRAG